MNCLAKYMNNTGNDAGVTGLLVDEHKIVLARLMAFETALDAFDLEQIHATIRFFDEQVVLHRRKEEEVLFPAMKKHLGTEDGPIQCMLAEHQDEQEKIRKIRSLLEGNPGPTSRSAIVKAGRYILDLLRIHIVKEDNIVFPLAESVLTDEEKKEVLARMKAIGFCNMECGG